MAADPQPLLSELAEKLQPLCHNGSVKADVPFQEECRLSVLGRFGLLDSEPEESFDQLTRLAAQHFRVPMALVALGDDQRQWFKSCIGLDACQTNREVIFGAQVILSDQVFVVEDASRDPRFRENPLVTDHPFVRFYAGAPLIIEEGVRLGAFAIMGREPRKFLEEDRDALVGFAGLAVTFIRQRLAGLTLKEAELARKNERSSYAELLVDDGVAGLYRSSVNGEILLASKAILDMLGYDSLNELRQASIDPDRGREGRARFRNTLEEHGRVVGFENEWYRKDGSPISVIETARAVRDETGVSLYYEGTVRDVTQQRNAEMRIKKSEERYRLLFDSNPLPAIVYSTEGDFKILALNDAAVTTYGYTHEEFPGLSMYDLVSDDLREELGERIRGIIRDHPRSIAKSTPFPHRTKNGHKIEAEITSHPLEFDNRPARLVIINDVTELVETQAKMRAALELAQSTAEAKADFLATMSHEIRTPVNGVIGMTSLLLDTELSPEQKEYADMIRRSGEALLTLINDILDFSKIDSGNLEIESVPFDLCTMTEESIDMVAEAAHRKELELISDIETQVPTAVVGDPLRIRQVLLNLLSNAIKFTSRGEVRLHVTMSKALPAAGASEAEPQQAGHVTVRFEVIDTGVGVSNAAKQKLFRSFSQGDASTSRRYGGSGLGLAISKRLTEIMGGLIGFDSEPGHGARFWVEIPLKLASPGVQQTVAALTGKHVLIVDDHSVTLRVLRQQLERMGAAVTIASSGATAVDLFRQGLSKVDACLIDSNLAGMSGVETARHLRELKGMADLLPVALMTRVTERTVMAQPGTRQWVDATCAKPLKRAQLVSTLTQLLDHPEVKAGPTVSSGQRPQLVGEDGMRILLAEDNVVNQKLAIQLVRKLGHTMDVAANGQEAVELFSRAPYAIVLMDAQMPEMDGYEATRAIRQLERGDHRAVIIALTANVMAGDREKCLEAGMDDYVPKPIQAGAFHQTLLSWMERIREQAV